MTVIIAALLAGAGVALTLALRAIALQPAGRLGRVLALHGAGSAPPASRLPAGRAWDRLAAEARQAGLALSVQQLLWVGVWAGGGAALVAWLLTGRIAAAAAGACAGIVAPRTWLRWRRSQQQDAYRSQLDAALLRLANHLRAGQSLTQAVAALAEHVKPPLGREFQRAAQAMRLNVSVSDSLAMRGDRISLPEFEEFVLAVRLHVEVGGNLAETLERIADQVRERRRVRAAIRAATSGSRAEALIVQATSLSMAALVPVVAPGLLDRLLVDPLGRLMGAGAVAMTVIAWVIVSRCLEVPYE